MFTKYLLYDVFVLVVSGALAVLGWKIGSIIRKRKNK